MCGLRARRSPKGATVGNSDRVRAMQIPGDLRYSKDHEWVRAEASIARLGITDYAQDALGDVVFVALPDVGASFDADAALGAGESTKVVSEVYAPFAGAVFAVNGQLRERP